MSGAASYCWSTSPRRCSDPNSHSAVAQHPLRGNRTLLHREDRTHPLQLSLVDEMICMASKPYWEYQPWVSIGSFCWNVHDPFVWGKIYDARGVTITSRHNLNTAYFVRYQGRVMGKGGEWDMGLVFYIDDSSECMQQITQWELSMLHHAPVWFLVYYSSDTLPECSGRGDHCMRKCHCIESRA